MNITTWPDIPPDGDFIWRCVSGHIIRGRFVRNSEWIPGHLLEPTQPVDAVLFTTGGRLPIRFFAAEFTSGDTFELVAQMMVDTPVGPRCVDVRTPPLAEIDSTR